MAQHRVAFITGGASGIGAACARHFCAQGWDVVVNYFSAARQSAAEELVALAERSGRAGLAIQGDVSCDEDCRRMALAIAARFGRLDSLVSSAGTTRIVPHRDLDGLTAEDFLRATAV